VLCATFNACLEADREQFTEALPFGLVSLTGSYDETDNPADPTRGRTLRLQLRAAPQWLGTAVREQVIGGRVAGTAYVPLSPRMVLAARVQGAVIASLPGADFIPQSERIFLGGASSVRGFRQNEVGPRVYIADSVRTVVAGPDTLLWALPPDSASWRAVPSGGTAGVNMNLELRMRPPILSSSVQFVAFLDGGIIWNRGQSELNSTPFVLTPGIGLRVSTIIGPIRFDIASTGTHRRPALRIAMCRSDSRPRPSTASASVTRFPVTGFNKVDSEGRPIPPVQAEGHCPSTFKPVRAPRFFDRLTINFSIGQAF
jgi:outer membrane protein insertion porin family/translocation and assembly module TamA